MEASLNSHHNTSTDRGQTNAGDGKRNIDDNNDDDDDDNNDDDNENDNTNYDDSA